MKTLSQNKAVVKLSVLRESFRRTIESGYETEAKNCITCEVQGSCCEDAHFVNVHISRLEAVAIHQVIGAMDPDFRARVIDRNRKTLKSLRKGFSDTYSCPLFENGIGCLVHDVAKPLPCINHACYENPSDLPPDRVLDEAEQEVNRLNDAVYKSAWNWMPIPEWIKRMTDQFANSRTV